MESIFVFMLVLPGISVVLWRFRLPPFLVLVGAAFFYGILLGMQGMTIVFATEGAGKIFALLSIPIFCGSLIAQVIRQENFGSRIVADMQRFSGKPSLSSGIVGYLLSVPLMCCLTAYVVTVPLIENLSVKKNVRKKCYYAAAIGSTLSFILLYPLPVMYSITKSFGIENAAGFNGLTIPISVLLFVIGYFVIWKTNLLGDNWDNNGEQSGMPARISRIAWLPIVLPMLLLAIGFIFDRFRLLSNINIAMFIAAVFSILLVKKRNLNIVFEKGTKNAGIILLDLCGAGALGGVIAASSFADDAYLLLEGTIPVILIPFILASLIQTAQGSRVVTAIITSSIIGYSSYISQLTASSLILMIAAGTLVVSYVTDPYFWLIQRTTGDSIKDVVYNYTLPLATLGILLLTGTLVLDFFLF